MNTSEFKSEWQWQGYYLKSLLTKPKELINNVTLFSKRSSYIFFLNIQMIYLIVNYTFQDLFVSNYTIFLQSTNTLATYFPSFELYFSNQIFFISFLIATQFVGFLLVLIIISVMISRIQQKSFTDILKKYLLFFAAVPMFLFNQKYLIASFLLMIGMNIYLTLQTDWKPIAKVSGTLVFIILFGITFTLFQGQVL